ncbi:MAG TPA: PEP-CTERM sorting domain-containing protein [Desulfobulbus sp.]|nr:PEP-CTERM sorting domain-containing protein [Desulfobulbus sp.]
MIKCIFLMIASAILIIINSAQATLIYSNDFENGAGSEWSSSRIGYDNDTTHFLGRFGNDTATLSLTGLPTHDAVTVNFDLILWDSWDGESTRWGKDYQGLTADNTQVYEYTFSNFSQTNQTNPDLSRQLYGKFGGTRRWQDSLYENYNDGFSFDHTASTLTLSFYGRCLQSLGDESWSIDNIRVYADNNGTAPVPEPATMLLFGTGLVGLVGGRMGKKKK